MLDAIIVVCKCASRVVWRINKHAPHSSRKFRFKCFQCQQVIAMNQYVVEYIFGAYTLLGVMRPLRCF